MLTKTQVQLVQSLQQKKFRQRYGLFAAAGQKVVNELLQSPWPVDQVYGLPDWVQANESLLRRRGIKALVLSPKELERLSFQEQPDAVVALVRVPEAPFHVPDQGWALALDGIRDPGNLGTLLRTAQWFGAAGVYLSPGCADRFNPKVVQASMGALFHIPSQILDPGEWPSHPERPLWGADARGVDLRQLRFPQQGILVVGSESHGISDEVAQRLNQRCRIAGSGQGESLNAAVAAGILLARALQYC
jgi:TrmH family RNA methyltransferase